MKPTIHQIIIGASIRDAITNMAIGLRDKLRETCNSNVYSFHEPDRSAGMDVQQMRHFETSRPDDVLIYHASFGIPQVTSWLLNRPEKLVLVYHNITPAHYYIDSSPDFAAGLAWGRNELEMLKPQVKLAVADSRFNRDDLESYGYDNVVIVPAGVDPYRLNDTPFDLKFLHELQQNFPNGYLLYVSQVLNHKRTEIALEVVHLLRTVHRLDVGLVVAGPMRNPQYMQVLSKYREKLSDCKVLFCGETTEKQLATLYRSCSMYLGTSDHEGLSIPPLEAMAAGAPVLARGAGAVAETIGTGGFVVSMEAPSIEIAEIAHRILVDDDLRISLIRAGYQRCKNFEQESSIENFVSSLRDLAT